MSEDWDEQTNTEVLPAPIDPAAAAFEALRKEVALVRRAMGGLAAERAGIEIPDYSETLAGLLQASAATANRLKALSETPALQRSASSWGREIAEAGETARRADQQALLQARASFHETTDNLRGWLRSAREADRQDNWLLATGIAGIVVGMILGAVVSGWLVPSAPTPKQGSPEQQAATILGMSEEKAGEHLVQTAAPKLWANLVLGDRIVIANRKALERCQRKARKQSERCAIELPADQP